MVGVSNEKFEKLIKEEAAYWDRNVREGTAEWDFFGVWQDDIVNEIFYADVLEECYEKAYKCGGRILELGCGKGNESIKLARYGNTVDAIDISHESIKIAKSNYCRVKEQQRGLGKINFIVGDLNRIALGKDQYDCVFAKSSLYLIPYLEYLMKELKRALKHGGYFIVFDNIGMKKIIMLLVNILVFVLPTTKSYSAKFALKCKLAALKSVLKGNMSHKENTISKTVVVWRSPFDSVSQKKIIKEIDNYFSIVDIKYFNFIMHYLLPRLKLPKRYKRELALYFNKIDRLIVKLFPWLGEFVRIFAVNEK